MIMFAGGALTSTFDLHSKLGFPLLGKHRVACGLFAAVMGGVGAFFFWCIRLLRLLNPDFPPLVASVILFVGFRAVIQGNIIALKIGNENKEFGLGWIYESLIFLFSDFVKSQETKSRADRYAELPLQDLLQLAESQALTPKDKERVNSISQMQDEAFKREWLSTFCASFEKQQGAAT
jgi:uncharacterized protein YhhL (DUF1145 family)